MSTQLKDKRVFPRITSRCPVVFQQAGSAQWKVGIVDDFSATGLKMHCKEALQIGEVINIELNPGSNKVIPAITAQGNVVRCEARMEGQYQISLKLTRVSPPKS